LHVVLIAGFCVCSEFFYIQMEKYARQALAEGVKGVSDLVVTKDDELYRVLILHYNRNNQIEVTAVDVRLFSNAHSKH
jgi:predicted kinase